MTRRSVVLSLVAAFALMTATTTFAVEPEAASLVGKWQIDTATMTKLLEGSGEADENTKALAKQILASMKLTVEFKGDGTMAVDMSGFGKSETKKGTWKLSKSEGKKLTLATSVDDKTENVGITIIDADSFDLAPPEGQQGPPGLDKMRFKRVKS